MIIKHKTQRRYQYGGSGIFDIIGKLASKVAAKTPEMLAKAQANELINKVTKEVVKQGEKTLVDNSGKLAKAAINKIVSSIDTKPSKDVIAKKMGADLISDLARSTNNLPSKSQPTNLNSLISGMGLTPIRGRGIILD